MVKFNKPASTGNTPNHALGTTGEAAQTFNGAEGVLYDDKSQLFLLATTSFFGESSFYEKPDLRTARFISLTQRIAVTDPNWTARFLKWLRGDGNIRTAAIVGAVEAAVMMARTKVPGGRQIVDSVLQRADEPGEALAYFMSKYGRKVPKPIKRGVADAVSRLYTEYNALKYDTASKGLRFGDVLELTHAKPQVKTGRFDSWDVSRTNQSELFKWLVDRTHGRENTAPIVVGDLPTILANKVIREKAQHDPSVLLNSEKLREAGMTWEDVLSLGGKKLDKKAMWEAMIPNMGYMALLRNLRNFSEANIDKETSLEVTAKLTNPNEVRKSRQLPMRFLSAYNASAHDLRWGHALQTALDLSLTNIPIFRGRTLILVDTSGSMNDTFSKDGTLRRWDAAVVFGLALARCCEWADVVSFSSSHKQFPHMTGESLLKSVERWRNGGFMLNGGTNTDGALRFHFKDHDRIVILTDEQADARYHGGLFAHIPASVRTYTFNLAGYQVAHAPSGTRNRVTVGGLSDAGFKMMSMIESSEAGWPF